MINYAETKLNRKLNEFEKSLFSATYSEHCGYLHSRKLLSNLYREGAVYFKENAGGFKLGSHAILFKMESHNHPCAVEPFNGAATGIGGIIRDVLAMNAEPIALCNSLKFGDNDRIKNGVIDGISFYGNCIGVPTVSTEVLYDKSYTLNPLVNVTAIGLAKFEDIITSSCAIPGQKLILAGSATMKDGLGGAAFASKNLKNNKEDKLSIQIANPFMKKKLIEASLEIFKNKLVLCTQDCGAAGILSSTSEIAFKSGVGVKLELDKVHTGDLSITPTEIMLSESQERMLYVLDETNIPQVKKILDKYQIEYSIIGEIIPQKLYEVYYESKLIGSIPSDLLVTPPEIKLDFSGNLKGFSGEKIMDINSKEIFEQYDSTVGARTMLEPYENPNYNELYIREEDIPICVYTFSAINGGTYETLKKSVNYIRRRGYTPMGITNCLNFPNPEHAPVMLQFKKTVDDMNRACKEFNFPICSGNVSFYNETESCKIKPAASFTMIGKKFIT